MAGQWQEPGLGPGFGEAGMCLEKGLHFKDKAIILI